MTLRGLKAGRYRVRDYFHDRDLGEIAGPDNRLPLAFHGCAAARGDTDLMLNAIEGGLLIEERRRRICEFLRAEGRVTVEALATRFGTSQVTIRADLSALEAAGALIRTHGGALLRQEDDEPLDVKQLQHHAEKVRIAQAAVAMIRDGETIILDSGTTTAEIARALRKADLKSINVITNALNVAALLMDVTVRATDRAGRHPAPRIQFAVRARWPKPRSPTCRPIGCTWAPTALTLKSAS